MGDWAKPTLSCLEDRVKELGLSGDLSQDTIAVSARSDKSPLTEAIVPPVYHTSIYRFKSVEHYEDVTSRGGHFYARYGNPTVESAECVINSLEGGAGSLVFNSGNAAISTVFMALLRPGDHLIAPNPSYSGTVDFLEKYIIPFGVEVSWVRGGCPVADYEKKVRPNTKLLFGETPCNPSIVILDLEKFGKLGKEHPGAVTVVDSTFGSPCLQQPIRYGVDISLHSCTKYMGGHSDLIGGCVTTSTEELWRTVYHTRSGFGTILHASAASLLHRGLKTLPVRMERHSVNAQKVAEYLEKHPKVGRIMYPGLMSHPSHEVAKKQMRGFGGMIMFELKGDSKAGRTLVNSVRLIQLTESLGGVESVIEQPATMTHGPMMMSEEARIKGDITDSMIRLSVGIENSDELVKDLEQALEKVA